MHIDRSGAIKTLTLDSPATSNSLTAAEVEALLEAVRESAGDGTETLVFTAQGANFCSGFDLSDLDRASDGELLARFVRVELLLQAVYMAPFDTVGCAKGATYGAGADLFVACPWRLADPGARFLIPGLQFGVALGTRRFAALVGETEAYELLAGGRAWTADHAQRIGFATELIPEVEWRDRIVQRHEKRKLRGEALASLASLTRSDTCAQDMQALAESASRPGLAARIRGHRDRVLK